MKTDKKKNKLITIYVRPNTHIMSTNTKYDINCFIYALMLVNTIKNKQIN